MDINTEINILVTKLGLSASYVLELTKIHGTEPETILDELKRLQTDRELATIINKENDGTL